MEPRIQYATTADGVNIAFWAIGEGPAWLRSKPLLALGFAANLGLALLLTRFAP